MNVTGPAPLDTAASPPATPGPAGQGGAAPAAPATAEPQAAASPGAATLPSADRVDIQPLNLAAALQILITELATDLAVPAGAPPLQTPAQAARALLQVFLQAVPDAEGAPATGAAARADGAGAPAAASDAAGSPELALQSALDRAMTTVAAWRNVPQAVVDGAAETRALAMRLLIDEPPNPLWLRPEWQGLLPRMERYWRRRRRRGFSDPDFRPRASAAGESAEECGPGPNEPPE